MQQSGFVGEVDCDNFLLSDRLQNRLHCLPCILYNEMHFNQFLNSEVMQGHSNARSHMS